MNGITTPGNVGRFNMNVLDVARSRHTAKSYRREDLSEQQVQDLLELLRLSSSSVNSQPWHFVVASDAKGRDRVARAGTDANFSFNSDAVRNAGLVVVFAARNQADETNLEHLLDREDQDGRFPESANKSEFRTIRAAFVDLNRSPSDPGAHDWMARQVYWNGGQFLHSVAAMGLDATPMEGIDGERLDREFGLDEKGYRALFAITVGRNIDETDWNQRLPKSRLPMQEIVTRL